MKRVDDVRDGHRTRRTHQPKPLYRAANTQAHGYTGGGRDYTPLFKFLLSAVGRPWNDVHSQAVARLDTDKPLYWIVSLTEHDRRDVVRLGNCSYYSGLFVDDDGILRVTNPDLSADDLTPTCSCCTHTFNGVPFGGQPAL